MGSQSRGQEFILNVHGHCLSIITKLLQGDNSDVITSFYLAINIGYLALKQHIGFAVVGGLQDCIQFLPEISHVAMVFPQTATQA